MIGQDQKEVRMWAMLCHLSALAGLVIPFGNVLGPLIVWLIKGKEDPFIDENGKEALNFQLSLFVYLIISAILILVLIGIFLMILLGIAGVILSIIAGVAANDGRTYRYPATIRFIK